MALLLGLSAPARAQDLPAVREELAQTDRRIEQAERAVEDSDQDAARVELREAVRLQSSARAAYSERRLRQAQDLTQRARARADRAIALGSGTPDPERVREQLERTDEILDDAEDGLEQCRIERARELLDTARGLQERAEATARGGQYLAALQLTMSARERAQRSLRLCNVGENVQANAGRAVRRTDRILGRAGRVVSARGDEGARKVLAESHEMQEAARRELGDRRLDAALRLTLGARALAQRAIRLAVRRSSRRRRRPVRGPEVRGGCGGRAGRVAPGLGARILPFTGIVDSPTSRPSLLLEPPA